LCCVIVTPSSAVAWTKCCVVRCIGHPNPIQATRRTPMPSGNADHALAVPCVGAAASPAASARALAYPHRHYNEHRPPRARTGVTHSEPSRPALRQATFASRGYCNGSQEQARLSVACRACARQRRPAGRRVNLGRSDLTVGPGELLPGSTRVAASFRSQR
jgi:hypothetical protein